jgi:hypothetical protein
MYACNYARRHVERLFAPCDRVKPQARAWSKHSDRHIGMWWLSSLVLLFATATAADLSVEVGCTKRLLQGCGSLLICSVLLGTPWMRKISVVQGQWKMLVTTFLFSLLMEVCQSFYCSCVHASP